LLSNSSTRCFKLIGLTPKRKRIHWKYSRVLGINVYLELQ
jgi:hypothetical protein